jgi:RNA polymerase sigma-70 factor (ECF subfamily)
VARSRQELEALYAQYGYLVHRRCLAILRDPDDANDALQEVFLRVQRSDGPREAGATLPWLYAIAANLSFDLLRRKKRITRGAEDEQAADGRGAGDDADGDRKALLGGVLRRLDERTRNIGVLHYVGGYTQEEVAERLGLSRRTVGKRLKLFEDRLRAEWRALGGL